MALNRGKCTRISSRSRSQPRFAVGRGNVGWANVGGVPFSLLAAIATNDKECKKDPVCARCGQRHDTRRCTKDDGHYKCINCSVSGFEDTDHMASSFNCPAYIAEQDKLKKSIHYYTKNC